MQYSQTHLPSQSSAVSENDRLGFTVVMALALHVLIVFGLGFESFAPDASARLMEVTLTQFKNDETPDQADFIAQHNQQGSGTLDKTAQLSTNLKSIYQDNVVRKIQLNAPTVIKSDPLQNLKKLEATKSHQHIYKQAPKQVRKQHKLQEAELEQLELQNMEIASLQAKLNQQKQLFAKGPKVRQITSVSAKASEDAAYINSFREKIEYVGNKYYPNEAKVKGLEGDVQLLVALKQDGNVHSIELIKSSNNPVLDRAAMNSVRLAAPYPHFTKKMRETTDILEIIRTWQFRSEQLSTRS